VKESQQSSQSFGRSNIDLLQSIRIADVKKIFKGWNGTDARNKKGHKVVVPVNELKESQQRSRSSGRSNSDHLQSIRIADVKKIFQGWNGTDDACDKNGHKVVVPLNELKESQQSSRSFGRSNSDHLQSIRIADVKKILQGWNGTDDEVVIPVNELKGSQQSSRSFGRSNSDLLQSIRIADVKKIFQGWNGTDDELVIPVNELKGSQQSSRSSGRSNSGHLQSIRIADVKKIFQGWNGTDDACDKNGHKVVVPVNELKVSQQSRRSSGDLRHSIRMCDVTSNAEPVSNATHRSAGDSMMSSAIEIFDDEKVVMIQDQNIGIIDEIGYLHKKQSSRESSLSMTNGNLYIASRSDQRLRKAELSEEPSFGSRARNRANSYFSETSESGSEL
jgi:hypothetical protein